MSPFLIVFIVISVLLLVGLIVLYILGKRAQKRKEEQDKQIASSAQTVSMLVIDKKRMRLTDAGLPPIVVEQTPKLLRRSKVPIVKAKVGPKVVTMICDADIFDQIPVKKEVKAVISGLYITGVKGLRGPIEKAPKKQKLMARVRSRLQRAK